MMKTVEFFQRGKRFDNLAARTLGILRDERRNEHPLDVCRGAFGFYGQLLASQMRRKDGN